MDRKECRKKVLRRLRVRKWRAVHTERKKQRVTEISTSLLPGPSGESHPNLSDNNDLLINANSISSATKDSGPDSISSSISDNTDRQTSDNASQHNESSSDSASSEEDTFNETEELRQWALQCQIPHNQLDALLRILRRKLLPDLPKSSKTFLRTLSSQCITEIQNNVGEFEGRFAYFGIKPSLQRLINSTLHQEKHLYLQFNIDGLPLFKSSRQQFWPILCQIFFTPNVYPVFAVAIYEGMSKPSNMNQYFEKFTEEVIELLDTGVEVKGTLFEISIKSFVCDRPARSLIKSIKGHAGFYACERCTVPGQRYKNRTVFVEQNFPARDNASFRSQQQSEHYNGISPLIRISELDMVSQFSLDFMHLCCLGVMKKLLNDYWIDGPRQVKFSHGQKHRLSAVLVQLQRQIPVEFQRTTRTLDNISKWKATEYRFFLLYASPILLKDVLSEKLYNHFLLFHVGCRILCSEELCLKYVDYAAEYFRKFVSLANELYGTESQVLNVHSLIHLADDVKAMSCSLSYLTAFPFENALGLMKKMLRSGRKPLSQICRRYSEMLLTQKRITIPPNILILKEQSNRTGAMRMIKKIRYKQMVLSNVKPNNTVLLQDKTIMRIDKNFIGPDDSAQNVKICGQTLRPDKSIFKYPCDSNIFHVQKVKEGDEENTVKLDTIASKMIIFEIEEGETVKMYVSPILHN